MNASHVNAASHVNSPPHAPSRHALYEYPSTPSKAPTCGKYESVQSRDQHGPQRRSKEAPVSYPRDIEWTAGVDQDNDPYEDVSSHLENAVTVGFFRRVTGGVTCAASNSLNRAPSGLHSGSEGSGTCLVWEGVRFGSYSKGRVTVLTYSK